MLSFLCLNEALTIAFGAHPAGHNHEWLAVELAGVLDHKPAYPCDEIVQSCQDQGDTCPELVIFLRNYFQ